MSKVKFNVDNKRSNNRQKGRILFVVTFHPKLKFLQNIINKHLYLLYMNDEVKSVFTPKPIVSFRSSCKISSYLVRAKLYPTKGTVDSFRCRSKCCEVCKYITETDTFTSSVTGETNHQFTHRLDCNHKCLVYLLTSNKSKKQYAGQTTDNFCSRWHNYKPKSKSFKREEKCIQEHLYKHFKSERHTEFLDDISITLIDKTDGSNPTKREKYWMRTLKTFALYGLNVADSIYNHSKII